jgi:ubiquinone/menaquinone biosynthesis C-methylase UbiE
MTTQPRLGELLLGIEGLALLRLAFADAAPARHARVEEMRALLQHFDDTPALAAPLDEVAYDLTEGYQRWAETYDRPGRLFPIEEPMIHALLDPLPPSVVLDAACGTGRHSAYLASRGHRLIGVDRSPAMLAHARRKLPHGDFREGNLDALPLASASVDAVVCALALIHVPTLGPVMQEYARVVRPGGRVVISDVHPFLVLLGWRAQFCTASGAAAAIALHVHLLSDYLQAFTEAGLCVRGCHELRLPPEAAGTVAGAHVPEAQHAAFSGLPGLVIWDLERDTARSQ